MNINSSQVPPLSCLLFLVRELIPFFSTISAVLEMKPDCLIVQPTKLVYTTVPTQKMLVSDVCQFLVSEQFMFIFLAIIGLCLYKEKCVWLYHSCRWIDYASLKSIRVHLVLRFCAVSWSYFDEFKYFKYPSVSNLTPHLTIASSRIKQSRNHYTSE